MNEFFEPLSGCEGDSTTWKSTLPRKLRMHECRKPGPPTHTVHSTNTSARTLAVATLPALVTQLLELPTVIMTAMMMAKPLTLMVGIPKAPSVTTHGCTATSLCINSVRNRLRTKEMIAVMMMTTIMATKIITAWVKSTFAPTPTVKVVQEYIPLLGNHQHLSLSDACRSSSGRPEPAPLTVLAQL